MFRLVKCIVKIKFVYCFTKWDERGGAFGGGGAGDGYNYFLTILYRPTDDRSPLK